MRAIFLAYSIDKLTVGLEHDAEDTNMTLVDRRQDTLSNKLIGEFTLTANLPHVDVTTPGLNVYRVLTALNNGDPIPPISACTPPIPLRVLPTMNLRTLRLKIRKTLKASVKNQVFLYLQMSDGVVSTLETDRDGHDLMWWGLNDETNILVFIDCI